MKHLIVLFLAFIPFILSCEKSNATDSNIQIREIAWSYLSEQEKSTVIVDWKKAPVAETMYQEKSSYAVSFNTSEDALLGPIIVYVEKASLVILGQGLRM